jgi:hypothetical protein
MAIPAAFAAPHGFGKTLSAAAGRPQRRQLANVCANACAITLTVVQKAG